MLRLLRRRVHGHILCLALSQRESSRGQEKISKMDIMMSKSAGKQKRFD
jgi:hypothetical protein